MQFIAVEKEEKVIAANEPQINYAITAREVRLIGENGDQLGIMSRESAMKLAEQDNFDLVNISPKAEPPVCKIMDYGKFKFEQGKKAKEAKKNQHLVTIKEMRLSATIDAHDLEVKAKNVNKFLAEGDKVKISIRFRGRQLTRTNQGIEVMNTFLSMLTGVGVERAPKLEGRSMHMILTPKAEGKPSKL